MKVAEPKSTKPKQDFNLNAVIDNLSSVGDLLIFNTDESPYLGTTRRASAYVPVVTSKVENKSLLEAAPSSIVNRDVLKRDADEYLYAPGIGMVSQNLYLISTMYVIKAKFVLQHTFINRCPN